MSKKETLIVYGGNGQRITKTPPQICILDKMNDVAFEHLQNNMNLAFKDEGWCYSAQARDFKQITKLLLTYNFKTRYYDNSDFKNTLMVKFAHDQDWD